MRNDAVIQVRGLGKRFELARTRSGPAYRTLREELMAVPGRLLRTLHSGAECSEQHWALHDVSFDVRRGEVVGVIGRNGAGKSTLLKILSRITAPTTGAADIFGRVGSLLEVGTGFHPELTGRENIFLSGAILGLRRAEVRRRFDEIVGFAEIERFLDTPCKHYSSGMYMRLGFAVAAHLSADILLVDEVLAVGDVAFQQKCLGKMRAVSTQEGRAVLFVSHNMPAVLQLTQRTLVFAEGRVAFEGSSSAAVTCYARQQSAAGGVHFAVEHAPRNIPSSGVARILSLRFDKQAALFSHDEDIVFTARVRARADLPAIRLSMTVCSAGGAPVGSCFGPDMPGMRAGEEVEFNAVLRQPRLAPGHYQCDVAAGRGDHRRGAGEYDVVSGTLSFEVRPPGGVDGTVANWMKSWGPIIFQPLLLHRHPL